MAFLFSSTDVGPLLCSMQPAKFEKKFEKKLERKENKKRKNIGISFALGLGFGLPVEEESFLYKRRLDAIFY